MKKLLLTTTALAGASVLTAGVATAAEAPSASLRGFYDFFYTYTDEDADTPTNEYADSAWYAEYEFSVRARGKADNGLVYGAKFEIAPDADTTRDEAGMYIQHANFGTLELGQDDGVAANMSVSLPKAWGTGGADGDYDEVVRGNLGANGGPKLVGQDMSLGDSSKISYYSPKFAGFDFGISYAFTRNETDDTRSHRLVTNGGNQSQESEIQMALRYAGEFSGVGVTTNLAYASVQLQENRAGGVNTNAFEDPSGFQFGLSLDWGNWTVGGGYVQWDDALRSHDQPIAATKAGRSPEHATSFNAGIQYKMGPWTIGANYMAEEAEGQQAVVGTHETEAYAFGARYALAPGLALNGEIVFFDAKGEDPTVRNDNDGTVLLIGTSFAF